MADTAYGMTTFASTRNPFNYDKIEQIDRDITDNWLTLTEMTNQLNLFGDTSQDDYLLDLELAVRMHIEDYLGMPIFPITYRVYYGISSQYNTPLSLDLPEVAIDGVTINSVGYYNGNTPSTFTTLASSAYYYDATGNKVILTSGVPSDVSTFRTSPIVVEYQTSPSQLSAYPVIKQAGLLLFTHLYNNRSDTTSTMLQKIPFGVDVLLRAYKPLVM
ncbi:gp6 domain containing protein [uncultured Caudovirales phage]|uniref:Gp6 domain containing protein n=1 Tax=uncultured Caudovirales phage TaxID=2100421 RepID=A0A6J5KPE8_9CAUD|nr:gp6 domain containing protein [uncultured Caudovirales phage]